MIKAVTIAEEYIRLNYDFSSIREACCKSATQFLDKSRLEITASDDGGIEFPDYILCDDVVMVSDYVISKIKNRIENYVFLKPVEVRCDVVGKEELYWIVVPPRIDCLDIDKSEVEYNWDFDLGIIPVLHCNRIYIDKSLIGRFEMFKVAGTDDNNIYIVDELYKIIKAINPEGIKFIKLQEEV